ncbi:MAG: phosphotransferase [Rhodospirillaceae bacterium]
MNPDRPPCDDPARLAAFLGALGLAGAECRPLTGDASSRRYQRILGAGRPPLILMQAPDPARELVPFVAIAGRLAGAGLSVPGILAADADAGLLLLEDFGDETFTARLGRGADPASLYALATDVLITLHQSAISTAGLPLFDEAAFLAQVMLLPEIVFPLGSNCHFEFEMAWRAVLPLGLAGPSSLLLRDYHAGNLMHLPHRPGVRACGLLDFQDAGAGPAVYDLISLIEDARRDLPAALGEQLFARYLAAFPALDGAALRTACGVLAAVRHTRVIAVFLRLARTGKPGYLQHLPRLWRYLDRRLTQPELAPLAGWFSRHLPPDRRAQLITESKP